MTVDEDDNEEQLQLRVMPLADFLAGHILRL